MPYLYNESMTEILDLRKNKPEEEKHHPQRPEVSYASAKQEPVTIIKEVQVPVAMPVAEEPLLPRFFEWEATIFHTASKSNLNIAVGVLFATGLGIYFIQHDIMLPAIFGLSALTMLLHGHRSPSQEPVTISEVGVTWADTTHYYRNLASFWIEYQPDGIKELILKTKKWYAPHIKIPLEDQNPVHIRALMAEYLPEEEHEYSFTDHLIRKL